MSASGLLWSHKQHAWVADEEAEAERAEEERANRSSEETVVRSAAGDDLKGKNEKQGLQGGAPIGRKLTVAEMEANGVIWAAWDGPDDPVNPYNWTSRKKWRTTWIVCFVS